MTNTQKIELATADYIGKALTAKEIIALTLSAFPEVNPTSIMPSDHAGAGKGGHVYADQLFQRSVSGYVRLADAAIVRKPRAARTGRGVSLADALASAKAKIADSKVENGEAAEESEASN